MNIKLDTENGNIKSIKANMTPTEFFVIRQILNFNCVYSELKETDRETAENMYKDINRQLKENQKLI